MVQCPSCGHYSPDFANYCQECGRPININNSDSVSDFIINGREFQQQEKYETALKCFKKAINLDPSNAQSYYSIGTTYFILGEYENALSFLNKFNEVAINPDFKSLLKSAYNLKVCINKGISLTGWDESKERDALLILKDDGIELQWKSFLGRDIGSEEIKYSKINSITFLKGVLLGTLEIIFSGGRIKIGKVHKDLGNLFVSNIRRKIHDNKNQEMVTSSPIDKIKEAKKLLDSGVITHDQFEEIKDKYLSNV